MVESYRCDALSFLYRLFLSRSRIDGTIQDLNVVSTPHDATETAMNQKK